MWPSRLEGFNSWLKRHSHIYSNNCRVLFDGDDGDSFVFSSNLGLSS